MVQLFKQKSIEIKDLDEKGIVTAYANVYDFEDSDGDISAKGSFTKTVKENFKRIRVLKDHNPRITLGVPLEIKTDDSYGLLTTTQFNMQKEVSRDMFTDIKLMKENGLNAELSIGYDIVSRSKSDKRVINEYKLMEYSFLSSWAANELSIVQSVKGIKTHHGIMEIIEKAYDLDYSDPRKKQIEQILISLTKSEPFVDTQESEAEKIKSFVQVLNNFKY
jgi:HK97 family phage prohead protease